MAAESDDELLTPTKAGKILGVTRWTVTKLGDDGRLPYVELDVGRDRKPDRRYRRRDVEAYKAGRPSRLDELASEVAELKARLDAHLRDHPNT